MACAIHALAMGHETADDFTLRGFGTLGLARSTADGAEFIRDLSQPHGIRGGRWSGRIDSILGLQANWHIDHDWEFVGQVVSRLHYDKSHNPELMWAFARWEPDPRLQIRMGRIGADFMMLADSRLVGYSFLPVRPPPDFFGPLFISHFTGLDVAVEAYLGQGLMRAKGFLGKTQEKVASASQVWDTSGSDLRGIVLDYQTGPWQLRGNFAEIRFSHDMEVGFLTTPLRIYGQMSGDSAALRAADSLAAKGKTTRYYALGAVYERNALRLQAMINFIRHETRIFQDSRAAFIQAGYRLGAMTPYVVLSRWKTFPAKDLQTLADPDLNAAYQAFIAYADVDRKTLSLGMRWDFHPQQALKVQWDWLRARPGSQFSFVHADPRWNGKTNILSLTYDFVF
ncbi:MAG: hypothetical protein N2441_04385 [Rhodocyclaceae bacterium]|nr:hypothetical protein [Rhodocyclaceae bacterium]